jgi:chromosome segregation ATPase
MGALNLQLTVLNGELAEINKKIEVLEKEEDDPKTDAKRLEVVQRRLHELKAKEEARNKQRKELSDKLQPGGMHLTSTCLFEVQQ